MDVNTKKKIEKILDKLPESGKTKMPAMTYEQGIEEVLLYLLDEITDEDFEYSVSASA